MSLGLWSQSKMWFGSLICCRAWSIWKTSWSTCLGFFLWNWQSGTPNSILHNYRMFSQILGGRRPPVEWWRQGMSATQKLEKDCGKQLVDWRSRFLRFLQALLRDTDAIYLFFPLPNAGIPVGSWWHHETKTMKNCKNSRNTMKKGSLEGQPARSERSASKLDNARATHWYKRFTGRHGLSF